MTNQNKNKIFIEFTNRNDQLNNSFSVEIRNLNESLRKISNNYSKVIQQSLVGTSYIQDSFRLVSQISNQLIKTQINSITPLLEKYQLEVKTIINSLVPQIETWNNWINKNQQVFDNISKFWDDFQKQYKITETKAIKILQKYKWFITPNMPISILYEIIKLDKLKGRQDKAINNVFIDYFADNNWENLNNMVNNWNSNPLFQKRRKILSDCVKTIILSENYGINAANVVLPTIITQIDGVISEYLTLKGISWDREYDDWVDRNTGKIKKVGRKSQLKR